MDLAVLIASGIALAICLRVICLILEFRHPSRRVRRAAGDGLRLAPDTAGVRGQRPPRGVVTTAVEGVGARGGRGIARNTTSAGEGADARARLRGGAGSERGAGELRDETTVRGGLRGYRSVVCHMERRRTPLGRRV